MCCCFDCLCCDFVDGVLFGEYLFGFFVGMYVCVGSDDFCFWGYWDCSFFGCFVVVVWIFCCDCFWVFCVLWLLGFLGMVVEFVYWIFVDICCVFFVCFGCGVGIYCCDFLFLVFFFCICVGWFFFYCWCCFV